MDNELLATTYTVPLLLQREDGLYKGGLCLSTISHKNLQTLRHQFLHEKEQSYFEALKYPKRQHSYLVGRFCAKHAIQVITNHYDLTTNVIENGIFQQPITHSSVAHNIQVSISHTESLGGAIAFPEAHPMGLDIEIINPDMFEVMKTQMSLIEQTLVSAENSSYYLWTAKEALSKVLRCGFMINMELLELESCIVKDNAVQSYFKHFHQYQALSFQLGKTICSLVYPRKTQLDLDITAMQKIFEKKQ